MGGRLGGQHALFRERLGPRQVADEVTVRVVDREHQGVKRQHGPGQAENSPGQSDVGNPFGAGSIGFGEGPG